MLPEDIEELARKSIPYEELFCLVRDKGGTYSIEVGDDELYVMGFDDYDEKTDKLFPTFVFSKYPGLSKEIGFVRFESAEDLFAYEYEGKTLKQWFSEQNACQFLF